jgi:hypothetical protein
MVLSLQRIFQERESTRAGEEEFEVSCSYLEVYNEVGGGCAWELRLRLGAGGGLRLGAVQVEAGLPAGRRA